MGIRIVTLEERKREKFEKELRGIILCLFILAIFDVCISHRFRIGFFISIFLLWGFFEWIIKLNRTLHRIENAKNLKEFLVAFIDLLVIIIRQELFNRIKNFIFCIWRRVSNI